MKISLLLIAGDNERFIAAASDAAKTAFPSTMLRRAGSLKEALEMENAVDPEIIAMSDASQADVAMAAAALDNSRLPRWAVVASGDATPVPFAEVVSEAGWKPGTLERVFRSVMELHLLRRERDRLLGDLLTIGTRIAHDLRSPLGGILAATEVLNELAPEGPNSERALTQPITESTADLVAIISQLTLLAKASALQPERKVFDMEYAASRALLRIEVRSMKEGATVLKPATWPKVLGDPSHSESIWRILLENALDHAGNRPKIEIGWAPLDEGYQFWIRDDGKGVPPEERSPLYQPFHRLHEPGAARGLGLSIAERLVALQGGRCGFGPQADGGSFFYFTLPSADAK
jgi:signal transduction histidine kinase